MKTFDSYLITIIRPVVLFVLHLVLCTVSDSHSAVTMNSYCNIPPFVAQSVPPLVMLDTDKSHKLYYQAYNDAADLNADGSLDIHYTHNIDYYGYFDSYKCYSYDSGIGLFTPAATTSDKFCSSNAQWSGNVLNWLTMSRMDVVRKVLYGGGRSSVSGGDTASSTILERAYIPMDAHSWGKELTGRLCNNGTAYTSTCSTIFDCNSGYTCVDAQAAGKYLTPYATSTSPTTCTSSAITSSQSGKILVARYQHSNAKSCGVGNSQGMVNSYEPGNLFHPTSVPNLAGTSSMVDYVTSFADSSLASQNYADNYNIIAVTNFTADVSGDWQFAVDGDDDVEVQVNGTVVAQYLGCHGFSGGQNYNGIITLTAGNTYTLVARHFDQSGGEGVQVWFKRPGATTWNYVSSVLASGSSCTANASLPAPTSGKILVARYKHSSSKTCGVGSSSGLIASYEPTSSNLFHPTSVSTLAGTSTLVDYVGGFDDSSLNPSTSNYADNYNIIAVTNFTADVSGIWSFAVDGDDDVEVQVNGTVVAQYLGCHSASGGQSHNGTIVLTGGTTYTLVARHFEQGGQEGVRVWFQRPGSSTWNYVNSSNLTLTAPTIVPGNECAIESSAFVSTGVPGVGTTFDLNAPLALSAPTIVSGNECAIETTSFVTTGIPTAGATVTKGTAMQNLFCNTTPTNQTVPLLRVVPNVPNRIWDWSAKERPECSDPSVGGYPFPTTSPYPSAPADYIVRVKVCDSGAGLETNCKKYGSSYKPTGLLQKYGEGDGSKVCSKAYSKTCNTAITDSSDCADGEGLCIYKSPMYFGMISGSYLNNLSGGVLRKNLGSMLEEINLADGTINSSYHGIINTYQTLKMVGYNSDFSWQGADGGTCGWLETGPLQNGQCRNWGNPLGEMLYETLRYFAGKGTPTADFEYSNTYDTFTVADGGLFLPHPSWGYKKGSTPYQPYDVFPTCSKPFMLILSDISPNYDSDQIPGSSFTKPDGTTFVEDSLTPQLGLGVQTSSGSLLNRLTDTIGSNEPSLSSPIAGNNWYIGQSNGLFDALCTSKNISKLSLVRGLCPEEPTKRGSYYTAALAYYGKTLFNTNTGKPNVSTYAVAMASPIADFKIKAGSGTVTIVPTGKSVSGCLQVKQYCADKCTLTYDGTKQADGTYTGPQLPDGTYADHGLKITNCATDAFCPTNQIVNFFVDDIRYDTSTTPPTVTYLVFRINYEDSEQGADHDMDTIIKYEVCTQAAKDAGYGSCTTDLGSNIKINLSVSYGAGCIDQVLGFIISGTTDDGTYLPVKDGDVPDSATGDTPAVVASMPKTWSKVFTPNNTPTDFLKNPLWYAAKWGGFNDGNGNNIPDLRSEWAKGCTKTNTTDCDPDNYYLVVNPLKLEQQLDKALTDILAKVSSGTAASIVNNSGESGTNILQALYFPQKDFSGTPVSWIGELQNMWFYLDPRITTSAIREDTVSDKILDLNQDLIANITFDGSLGKTMVNRTNNNGTAVDQIELDELTPLWRAGQLLHDRNLSTNARTIKTSIDGSSLINFSTTNNATLQAYLQAADPTEASKIINYVIGNDTPTDTTIRNRTVTYKGTTGPWRLGDIISSTPRIQGGAPIQGYDLDYNDLTYKSFWGALDYKKRNMVYAGSNDGMLHAFTLGVTSRLSDTTAPTAVARILPNTSPPLGQEEWAYIPKNALPYLRYQLQPDYSHLYTVDGKIRLIDVSINVPTSSQKSDPAAPCDMAHYWNCLRTTKVINTGTLVCSNDYTSTCVNNSGCVSPGTCSVPNTYIDPAETSWRTILVAGMGLGGASRSSNGTCLTSTPSSPTALPDCVKTPITTPTGYENIGLSSYVAMDVTTPSSPTLLWEFSAPGLGYTLSQPAIVRINGKKGGGGTTANDPDTSKNGRWFAVFASGPTGPLNTVSHQFYGKSDQNLKLFVVDLGATINASNPFTLGTNYWVIDTGIGNAFGGQFGSASAVDTDAWNPHDMGYKDSSNNVLDPGGYYSTDAVYLGYTNYDTVNSKWDGGVGRLVTKEDPDPTNWQWSKVIEKIGPVTTAVTMLQDTRKKNLWLYFGTGRYYYKDSTGMDDPDDLRYIYGITEPCYPRGSGMTAINDLDVSCTTQFDPTKLVNKSDDATSTANTGWKIQLWGSWSQFKAERVLTNPTALYTGNVSFTTFQPTADICGFGGQTFVWVVDGMSGGTPAASSLIGQQILVQLTTGAFAKVNFQTDLKARLSRRTGTGSGDLSSTDNKDEGPTTKGGTGNDESKILKPPKGVPRILHYKER